MPLNNKAALVHNTGLCLMLVGCAGASTGPHLPYPVYQEVPQSVYSPSALKRSDAQPTPANPTPLQSSDAGPAPVGYGVLPFSTKPSGTSDREGDRYDEVGYASWYGPELVGHLTALGTPFNPAGFTAAHRTLPLGSYVEVTSLDTGRTILVEINDRGPHQTDLLIDLAQGAANQLGVSTRSAVRVRRVTPSPRDVAALSAGQPGAPRLDTPSSLLAGLRQRLPGQQRTATVVVAPDPILAARPPRVSAPASASKLEAARLRGAASVRGEYYVQVAALGNKDRAMALAESLGGSIISVASLWRVRMGPYANAIQAAQARDAVAARGYGDARVVRQD